MTRVDGAGEKQVLLECQDLSKSYGGVKAVRNASLQVRAGEIVGLVGPNGAGKTTLVDLVCGEQKADSGRVVMNGAPLTGTPSRRARVGGLARTFQHPQLALELTVRENILVGHAADSMLTGRGMIVQACRGLVIQDTPAADLEITEVARALGLQDTTRLCADLTLGEQRLVEVARALMRRPSVILLDEPFAGGDARGVAGVTQALRELLRRDCGVLVVDHNVDIVSELVHRIVLMDQGAVIFDGDPTECLSSPEMQDVYFGSGSQG